ncbi:PPE family protein [Labedaea rhizosphaerae]|uniref:PPE family protein n=2 Tax=Labedaea rhizosphaerae TaxID=598644 RepID=A0A4R6SP03_LABRH|nr:PPE family protein [Labedaea rhizosphaerae]
MFAARPGPEPTPTDLDQPVDWMTYQHAELYRMVHEGVDLDGATDVSARWAALGEDLEQLSRDLAAAVAQVEHAWEGPAADSARESVNHLVNWTKDTGVGALEASGCVTREINNLAHARRAMPAPFAPPVDTITPDTFNGDDFVSVAAISSDNTQVLHERREAHKQAAGVMQEFQGGSREVYGTVPAFSSPYHRPRIAPKPEPRPEPPPHTPPQDSTQDPAPRTPVAPRALPAEPLEAAPAAPGPSGGPPVPAAAAAHEDRPEQRSTGPGRSMGMVPGMGGARREEDQERKAPKYLEADDDLWGSAGQVAPPVIGEPGA